MNELNHRSEERPILKTKQNKTAGDLGMKRHNYQTNIKKGCSIINRIWENL